MLLGLLSLILTVFLCDLVFSRVIGETAGDQTDEVVMFSSNLVSWYKSGQEYYYVLSKQ